MEEREGSVYPTQFLARDRLGSLLDVLRDAGFRCLGPQVRGGAVVFDELTDVFQLPQGVHDEQKPGIYRLRTSDSPRHFAWANGPQAIKPQTFAARETLWKVERDVDGALKFVATIPDMPPTALIGARACDLAGLRIQDRIFLRDKHKDPYYAARREKLFLVAVNCSHPASTCFCASTGDGPKVSEGHDIVLTELEGGYLVQAGTERGQILVERLPLQTAGDAHFYEAGQQYLGAVRAQTRTLPHNNKLREPLFRNLDHARWDEVAERCLSCGNCTLVCPTCFCHNELEDPKLTGGSSDHYREWDSCFTQGHSYLHGSVLRDTTKLRYRQWLTHKLGSWHDQFGMSGCVGCGRCIAWCPTGIDITEEAWAICGTDDE